MCAQLLNLIAKWLISVFAPPLKLSRAPSLRGLEGIKSSDRELIFFRNSRLLVCFLSTLFTLKRTCSLFCCRDTHESKYLPFNQRISNPIKQWLLLKSLTWVHSVFWFNTMKHPRKVKGLKHTLCLHSPYLTPHKRTKYWLEKFPW